MKIGYFLATEAFGPGELLAQAQRAERAGFDGLWISDHFHPWTDEQGQSPFVWSVIGGIAVTSRLPVTTAVTCPTIRTHPAIIAHAAATSAVMLGGRFTLGLGSGEALNELILGDRWPPIDVRLDMLEEAVEVIRQLWAGEAVSHHGRHYVVEHARLYTRPDRPPPIYVSAFGPKAAERAARIADGLCSTMPDGELVKAFRNGAGNGKPVQGGMKVCVCEDSAWGRQLAHRLWPNDALPGELAQVLRTPEHIMQAAGLVSEEMIAESVVCGRDVDEHLHAITQFVDAGYDEVYVNQIGPDQEQFFAFYGEQILPRLRRE